MISTDSQEFKILFHARLVKCKAQSAGKTYGTSGAKAYVERLTKKHNKGKALSILAHKLGRAVYFMLKRKQPFNMDQFLAA